MNEHFQGTALLELDVFALNITLRNKSIVLTNENETTQNR